MTVFNK